MPKILYLNHKGRRLALGAGRPKICIPIVGRTREEILAQAETLLAYPADLAEFRADWFEGLEDEGRLLELLAELRALLKSLPLLFTIRTSQEGGEARITPENYRRLNLAAARSGLVDLVDVELFAEAVSRWELPGVGKCEEKENAACADRRHEKEGAGSAEMVRTLTGRYARPDAAALVGELQKQGVAVIGSSHDFEKTPRRDILVTALRCMQELGADVCKLAVMPERKADVAALLFATEEMKRCYADRPLITMAMGQLGLISRLAGEIFGSSVTFGAAGKVSAPGQIGADRLADCLELLRTETNREKPAGGHIFLIGFMGAGKSTVAAELERLLGRKRIEMDACIEERAGQSIASVFEQYGEDEFRRMETEFLFSMENMEPCVVSCGGGVVVRPENTEFMKAHGCIILLTAAPATVLERVKDSAERPILNGHMNVEYIEKLQEKRRALYEAVADVTIATDGRSVEEICGEILDFVGRSV